MKSRAWSTAESATRTESVRMYVISPTGPSAPTSTPSYSCCAIRILIAAEKPSCFAASCCSVLVRNGGGAGRRRSPFSTVVTRNDSLRASATMASAAAASLISGLRPSSLWSRAWNGWPSFSRSASTVQYSCGTKPRISSSRSQMRRRATVCTRPAERPRLLLDGDVLRREAVLDVHPQLALRQIAHVPHRGLHGVARAEVLADRLRLGRRLDDDERTLSRLGLLSLHITLLNSHASTSRQTTRKRIFTIPPCFAQASSPHRRSVAPSCDQYRRRRPL